MADEEAVLKKKLEDTTDFEERREIRQQLRELRKKKLDALQSDSTANDRPRRRERVKKEEQSTVIKETKTSDVSDGDSSQRPATQTTIEVNYSRTVITDGSTENGIENGHVESEKSVEEETVSVENENPVEEQPVEIEIGTQFSIQINGEKSGQDSEEDQGETPPQELSTETETVVESSETVADDEEPQDKEEETEEVELTPEVVEKMEDVDQLEKLLKEVPLNEYALRKAIRLQIRQLRVKKEASRESETMLGLKKVNRVSERDNLAENDVPSRSTPSERSSSQIYGTDEFNTETKATASTQMKTNNDDVKRQSVASDSDVDDASMSSSTSEGTCTSELNPKTPPPRPPKPSRPSSTPSTTSTRTDAELKGDFKTKILGTSASPLRDLTKKKKPSGPEQLDFRGQLKKTGLRADKDLTAQGKKQQQFQEGDFRRQLKSTGVDTARNLSASRNVGKKKGGVEQVDFRGQLNKTQGLESALDKKAPTRPPPTYLSKKPVPGALASQPPAKTQTTEAKEDTKTADVKEVRKISSADLLNMVHKPVETSRESFLVQRGIKKAEASKSAAAPKFIAPSTGSSDETFHAQMARRKERSEKLILPANDSQTPRRTSTSDETKDFRAVLKKAAAQKSRGMPKRTDLGTEEQPSTGEVKQNERFSIDIQDKNELQKLRADLMRQRKESTGNKSITSTVEQGDGGKEVTTTMEKTTEVEETDGGQAEITTEVKKTTEVHKVGGATMTVTKTSRTTEVRQTGGGKGKSIDALFAEKKKEKMMAKKKQQADTKNMRTAFKQQLEAQSPKVEGGRNFSSGNTAINQLQEWCRRRTKYHEGVDIQNFTTSWANGLAMCALLNYFLPDKIPFDTLDPSDKRGNWALAFKVAGEEGIEPLLELEDVMSVDVPEPKSLITYIHFIYTHFSEKQGLQKKA